MRSASIAEAQGAKIQEPVPGQPGRRELSQPVEGFRDRGEAPADHWLAIVPTAGPRKKARIVMTGEFRVNSGLWNTSLVPTWTPG